MYTTEVSVLILKINLNLKKIEVERSLSIIYLCFEDSFAKAETY